MVSKRGKQFFKIYSGSKFIHRSAATMVMVNSHLLNALGVQYYDTSAWAMNHASLSNTDETVLGARKGDYDLYLTTNRQIINSEPVIKGYRQGCSLEWTYLTSSKW